ncbi:MAG: hypothetical protein RL410_520 [Actinomycetota bacterium]|jgi:large subunit ribosomal protein L17
MPTPTKGPRLGGSPSHQKAILANLAQSLFEHGRITTTEAKAKRLRPYAEKLITAAKRGDLHARRNVARDIRRKDILHVLFAEIGPRFATRPGGYTRITKLNPRQGDNAPMAMIELVEPLAEGVIAEATGATKRAAKEKAAKAAAPAAGPVETAVEAEVAAEEAVEEVVEETAEEVAEIAAEDAEATEADADGEAKA